MESSFLALLYSFGFLMLLLIIAWYVLQVVAYWRIFTKAGQAGWKSLIPFYKTYVQYRITWNTSYFWIWLICVLGVSFCPTSGTFSSILASILSLGVFIMSAVSAYKLSAAYGHGIPFALGIFFLEPIFIMILGFGSSTYMGPQDNGFF